MKKQKISIVDYGVGNLRSLIRAFEHFGANVQITEDASVVAGSDAIVLPGDGAFKAGMDGLRVRNLAGAVLDFAKMGKPILGICLGAQILLSLGYEFGQYKGLGLIPGKVSKFPKNVKEKIPQIGWNEIYPLSEKTWSNTIFGGIKPGSHVYFIHSYIIEPEKKADVLALTKYGDSQFCSAVRQGKIYGCQFHPEKSGWVGLTIINNFIDLNV